ncbi:MAG: nucleotidyltransferase family protein [Rhodobacter sp.]|nr:nucleotidyltransferase family protein [Rhodobacter sp.]
MLHAQPQSAVWAVAEVVSILLAAGQSKRFGRDKTRLVLDGETLLERHIRQISPIASRVAVVANAQNRASIEADPAVRQHPALRVVQQAGRTVESGIATGLRQVGPGDSACVSCVNDLVPDDTYARLQATVGPDEMAISVAISNRAFPGGLVTLNAAGHVAGISEKPPGGCPPGALINVFLHWFGNASIVQAVLGRLETGAAYEPVLTDLVGAGLVCHAVRLDAWRAIKHPEDWARVSDATATDGDLALLRRRGGSPA